MLICPMCENKENFRVVDLKSISMVYAAHKWRQDTKKKEAVEVCCLGCYTTGPLHMFMKQKSRQPEFEKDFYRQIK